MAISSGFRCRGLGFRVWGLGYQGLGVITKGYVGVCIHI